MGNLRVLIVEDQREVGRMLAAAIATLGVPVDISTIPSAEEAVLEDTRRPADLMVIDFRLPGISGVELVKKIKARRPAVKVILITGVTDARIRQQVSQAGADAYFFKPIEMPDFLSRAEQFLGITRSHPAPAPDEDLQPAGLVGAPEVSLAERLSRLRETHGVLSAVLLDDRGTVLAQAGDLPELANGSSLANSLAGLLNSGLKASQAVGAVVPEQVWYFKGPSLSLCACPVDAAYVLLVASRERLGPENLSAIASSLLETSAELAASFARLGVPLPLLPEVSPPPAQFEEPASVTELAEDLAAILVPKEKKKYSTEEVNAFWESLGENLDVALDTDSGVLTYDQARKLGLAPDEQ